MEGGQTVVKPVVPVHEVGMGVLVGMVVHTAKGRGTPLRGRGALHSRLCCHRSWVQATRTRQEGCIRRNRPCCTLVALPAIGPAPTRRAVTRRPVRVPRGQGSFPRSPPLGVSVIVRPAWARTRTCMLMPRPPAWLRIMISLYSRAAHSSTTSRPRLQRNASVNMGRARIRKGGGASRQPGRFQLSWAR